jgi:hypothetical protein
MLPLTDPRVRHVVEDGAGRSGGCVHSL